VAISGEFVNLIVQKSALSERFAGGLMAFRDQGFAGSYVEDEHLSRLGFMSTSEAEEKASSLGKSGLRWGDDLGLFTATEPATGFPWLTREGGVFWLAGREPGPLFSCLAGRSYLCPFDSGEILSALLPAPLLVVSRTDDSVSGRCVLGPRAIEIDWMPLPGEGQGLALVRPCHGRIFGYEEDFLMLDDLDHLLQTTGARST
jgi:hypothetical protein